MDGLKLLGEAAAAGLTVLADGDRLVIRGPKSAGGIARRLMLAKAEILSTLAGNGNTIAVSPEKTAFVLPLPPKREGKNASPTRPEALADKPAADTSGGEPEPIDAAAYVAEHGCYPPGGIGGPGYLARWLAEQVANGFGHWSRAASGWERWDVAAADWDSLPEPDWACPKCNGLLWWEDLRGGKHCLCCERKGHERALRLLDRAARLRAAKERAA